MVLTMVLMAINGAAAHVASTQGAWPKARLAVLLTYLFVKELLGFAVVVPSVSRSVLIYSSLPSHPMVLPSITSGKKPRRLRLPRAHLSWLGFFDVSVARNIAYGSARRNLLDVYVPGGATRSQGQLQKWPAVMFVHGGIWATGSKELFSHLGACLAQSGVLTVVVQYTLFPEVLAWKQAREVSSALTWFLDNAEQYGADPHRLTLMGHSAGAHLCALVLWERFKAAQCLQHRWAAEAGILSPELRPEIDEEDLDKQDIRQPCNFIGIAGVYDIVGHLKYEQKRGVDSLSCMTPAMGGKHLLEAMSPVHLFQSMGASTSISSVGANHGSVYRNIDSAIIDNMDHLGAIDAGICEENIENGNGEVLHESARNFDDVGVVSTGDNTACCQNLLRCTLISSWGDTVVPPDSSISFHAILQEQFGHQSQLIMFDNLKHSDFISLDGRSPEQVSFRRHILGILQRNTLGSSLVSQPLG
ncbi:hypothetical protein L7F22_013180 [Adiantum nelumboides]|nr:hypothetical protein [Adiantum nelumboides]